MAHLEDRLAALATMSPEQLRAEWQGSFNEAVPDVPTSLLRLALAHHLQEKRHGGLPASAVKMLNAIASDSQVAVDMPVSIKPGTRLLREWNGKLHAVVVADDCFMFDNRRFASLSHIAREITGAHWSGPRFFGLKLRRPLPPSRGVQAHG